MLIRCGPVGNAAGTVQENVNAPPFGVTMPICCGSDAIHTARAAFGKPAPVRVSVSPRMTLTAFSCKVGVGTGIGSVEV